MAGNYELINVIGSGTYGDAWLARDKETKRECVVKIIKILKLPVKELERCLTEVSVLARCNHDNIVKYLDAFVHEGNLHIAMEFADGGDLHKRIVNQKGIHFGKEVICDWFVQICLALEYIHSQNILHRDLKSQNIFLTSQHTIKLGDFGIARVLKDSADHALTAIGTPFYLSPEICQRKPYNHKSDMWALGCVLYEMCCLHVPFNAKDFDALVVKILQGKFDPVPKHFGNTLETLSNRLLSTDPDQRPSAREILCIPSLHVHVKRYQPDRVQSETDTKMPDVLMDHPKSPQNTDTPSQPGSLDTNGVKSQGQLKQKNPESIEENAKEIAKETEEKKICETEQTDKCVPVKPSKLEDKHKGGGLRNRRLVSKDMNPVKVTKDDYPSRNVMKNSKYVLHGKRLSDRNMGKNVRINKAVRNIGLKEQKGQLVVRKYSSNTAEDDKTKIEGSNVKVIRDHLGHQKSQDKENIDPRKLSGKTFTVQNPKFRHLSVVTPRISKIVARQKAALSADDDKTIRRLSEQYVKDPQCKFRFEMDEDFPEEKQCFSFLLDNPEEESKEDDDVFCDNVNILEDNKAHDKNSKEKSVAIGDGVQPTVKNLIQEKKLPRRSTSCDNVTKVKQFKQSIGQRAMSEGDIVRKVDSKTYVVAKQARKGVQAKGDKLAMSGKRTVAVFIAKTFFTSILESRSSPTKAAAAIASRLTEMFGQARVKELSMIVSQCLHQHQDFSQIPLKFTEKEMVYFPLVAQYVYLMNVMDSL